MEVENLASHVLRSLAAASLMSCRCPFHMRLGWHQDRCTQPIKTPVSVIRSRAFPARFNFHFVSATCFLHQLQEERIS